MVVILGTKPEAIKLFPVVTALSARSDMETITCVTAQHREMLDQVLAIAGIIPQYDLDIMRSDQSLDQFTARLLTKIGETLSEIKPQRVVVQGDTTTATCGALAAYYRKIPVSHVEAGRRSDNIYCRRPEEVTRKIIGTIADQHFAPTETSAAASRKENIAASPYCAMQVGAYRRWERAVRSDLVANVVSAISPGRRWQFHQIG